MTTNEDSDMIPPAPADAPSAPGGPGAVNPAAMTVDQAARLLSAAGRPVTADMVRAALEAGAPVGTDGRINLIDLMAWLEKHLDNRS